MRKPDRAGRQVPARFFGETRGRVMLLRHLPQLCRFALLAKIASISAQQDPISYDNVPGASDDIDSPNPQAIASGSIVTYK